MRIGVIGLGAIGGVMAQRLSRAGIDLALAAGRHAGAWCATYPQVQQRLPAGRYDLVLLCTRTAETRSALAPAVPFLARDGAVVCLQNGLPESAAAELAGRDRVLGAVIGWSASLAAPGRAEVTGGGKFTLGGTSPRLQDAAEVLRIAFPVRISDNLEGARWSKLAINCAMSTLGAVSGLSLGELAARRAVRTLALNVIREVAEEGAERGVRLERIAGVRPDLLVQAPSALAHAAIWLAARRRPHQRTGMIARLEQGRTAGIEDLNALIDRPLNRQLTSMVRQIEQGVRAIAPANLAELS